MVNIKTIEKKVSPTYFLQILYKRKSFEIRKDEDDIEVGDILFLREWENNDYTGAYISKRVTYTLRNAPEYGLQEGYVIIGFNENCIDYGGIRNKPMLIERESNIVFEANKIEKYNSDMTEKMSEEKETLLSVQGTYSEPYYAGVLDGLTMAHDLLKKNGLAEM